MACKEFETYAPRSSGSPSLVLGNVLTFLSRYCRFRRTDYAHCWIQGIRPIEWVILAILSLDVSNNFVCHKHFTGFHIPLSHPGNKKNNLFNIPNTSAH